ncbi:MAG: alpha/beta hydrolase, partial [Chloroflexota bacterium]
QVACFPAQLVDCRAAVAWLRAHAEEYGLDGDRVGAWGASAGGHLVALLGVAGGRDEFQPPETPGVSTRVQAVCDWFGPTDFLQMDAHVLPGSPKDHDDPDSPESQLVGGPIQANVAAVQRANPLTYVTADAPPFLVMHGTHDPLVPIHQSELLVQALRAVGCRVAFERLEGVGHGGPGFQRPEVLARVRSFFVAQFGG